MKNLRFESIKDIKKKVRSSYGNDDIDDDAMSLIEVVNMIKGKIDNLNANLNEATDPDLIEGFVYELKSLHIKYDFFIRKCKDQGLTVDFF